MAISISFSNHFAAEVLKGSHNLSSDDVTIILMRDGFSFDQDAHATLTNLKADTGSNQTISSDNVASKFTWSGGTFVTSGFVVGNHITVSGLGAADGTYDITSVSSETEIIVTPAPSTVGADNDEQIVADDELATANGYIQGGLSETVGDFTVSVSEDDINNQGKAILTSLEWTASGGTIGPTPGAIIYNDTEANDSIIGYIDFGGDQSATDGNKLKLENITLKVQA